MNSIANVEVQVCSSCGGVDHKPNECTMYVGEVEQDNALVFPNRSNPFYSNTYKKNNGKTTQTLVGETT